PSGERGEVHEVELPVGDDQNQSWTTTQEAFDRVPDRGAKPIAGSIARLLSRMCVVAGRRLTRTESVPRRQNRIDLVGRSESNGVRFAPARWEHECHVFLRRRSARGRVEAAVLGV